MHAAEQWRRRLSFHHPSHAPVCLTQRRGDDASKVVREVILRVEAAVPGAVAPPLPAGGTAGKEAQAPGAAAAYAAKRLYYQRHYTHNREPYDPLLSNIMSL